MHFTSTLLIFSFAPILFSGTLHADLLFHYSDSTSPGVTRRDTSGNVIGPALNQFGIQSVDVDATTGLAYTLYSTNASGVGDYRVSEWDLSTGAVLNDFSTGVNWSGNQGADLAVHNGQILFHYSDSTSPGVTRRDTSGNVIGPALNQFGIQSVDVDATTGLAYTLYSTNASGVGDYRVSEWDLSTGAVLNDFSTGVNWSGNQGADLAVHNGQILFHYSDSTSPGVTRRDTSGNVIGPALNQFGIQSVDVDATTGLAYTLYSTNASGVGDYRVSEWDLSTGAVLNDFSTGVNWSGNQGADLAVHSVAAVPEPSALLLVSAVGIPAWIIRRNRKRQASAK